MEKTAFLFAGQGSQYVGMGKDLYEAFPESKAVYDKASQVLGFDLTQFCFHGPSEQLKQTRISQPAIVTTSIALYEAFKSRMDVKPAYAAGLSLGEYSALIAMNAFSFAQGIGVVIKRGQIMDEAAQRFPGTMAAVIDLALDTIQDICRKTGGVEIANLNCPGQVIISGTREAVAKAQQECTAAGAKRVIELEVSGGFHSPLMFEASGKLKGVLDDTQMMAPKAAIISNYTAAPEIKPADIRQNLVYQLYSTVKWEDSVRFMLAQGVTLFYEFGPGRVLRGLLRKIDPNARVISIEKKEDILALANG